MNWPNGFFKSGFYQRAYWFRVEAFNTVKEVENIIMLLKPKLGSHILDWCGGWGRHTVELAKRGFEVTLLDYAPNHIAKAMELAREAGVELKYIIGDFRETPASIQADYAINVFTAGLGYLTEDDDLKALRALHAALKPGAKVLIDTINLFWLMSNYRTVGLEHSEDGKRQSIDERNFDFWTNRNHYRIFYDEASEEREEIAFSHRIYSAAELAMVLCQAGFKPIELYGGLDGREFTYNFDEKDEKHVCKRIVMIARRV